MKRTGLIAALTLLLPIGMAQASPCIIALGGDGPQSCGASAQQIIQVGEAPEGLTIYSPMGSSTAETSSEDMRIITPNFGNGQTCSTPIKLIPDSGNNTPRYELCFDDLMTEDGLDLAATYDRIKTATNRTCRANGAITYPASKYCRRDVLYRAVLDAQTPELTALYREDTGRGTPRIEVDPAKTY